MSTPISAISSWALRRSIPGDRDQCGHLRLERGDHPVDLGRQVEDDLVEEVELGEDLTDQQPVMSTEAALEGVTKLGDLLAQGAFGQVGQDIRIAGAGDERVEHRPTGQAEDPSGDRGQLDPGVLEHLVQPLLFPGAFFDLRAAVTAQVAQLADLAWRHEARADQSVFDQLTDPRRVGDVGLASRHVTQVLCVEQPTLHRVLQHEIHRLPIHPSRFHPDQRHPHRDQPVPQRQQLHRRRAERDDRLLPPPAGARGAHTGHHRVLVHVEPAAALHHNIHSLLPSRSLRWSRRRGLLGRTLTFVLEATLLGARGPHVRLKRGLDDTNKSPTSPAAPPEFHTFLTAARRPARLKRSVVLWVKEATR
jgi:hypothetical protein